MRWNAPTTLLFLFCFCGGDLLSAHADVTDAASARAALRRSAPGASTDHVLLKTVHHLDDAFHLFQPTVLGRPVFFEQSVVRATPGPVGLLRRTLPRFVSRGSADSRLPVEALLSQLRASGHDGPEVMDEGWLLDGGILRNVYRIDVAGKNPMESLSLYVDVSSGRIRASEPLAQTVSPPFVANDSEAIIGAVYPENPITTPKIAMVALEHLDPGAEHLFGAYARVGTCVDANSCDTMAPQARRSSTPSRAFVFDPLTIFDPGESDPFAEVSAYHNITTISDWVRREFGWDGLFAGETWISVHVGQNWDNAAYYAGSRKRAPRIVFGMNEDINYAYDADTAYHEYGHAINDLFWPHPWVFRDEYGLNTSMFGIEEGLADIWSFLVSEDPVLDAYVTASRNAANSTRCPEDILSQGHYDARIVGGFAWDLREIIGAHALGHIVYRSLSILDNETTFGDFAAAMMLAAGELASSGNGGAEHWHVDVIQETARARGFLSDACERRLVPFPDNERRYVFGYGRSRTRKMNEPTGQQWEISVTDPDRVVRLHLDWRYPEFDDYGEPVNPGYRVHLRKGSPVEVVWLDIDTLEEGEDAFEVVADVTFGGAPKVVSYPVIGGEPLTTRDTVYVLLSAETDVPNFVIEGRVEVGDRGAVAPPSDIFFEDEDSGSAVAAATAGAACSVFPKSQARMSPVTALLITLLRSFRLF